MTTACCKVGCVIEAYNLESVDDELRERRASASDSLRTLQRFFNQRVLRAAMEDAGMDLLDGEVENAYRLLTDDDVSSGMRIRVRNQLEEEDVDLESVEESFVSHPTMGRHLEDCLEVERAQDEEDRTETAKERIFKMESRAEAVIANTLSGLESSDRIDAGEIAVTVNTQVMCESCGVHAEVERFIDAGGCNCEPEGAE